jgi:protein LTV1
VGSKQGKSRSGASQYGGLSQLGSELGTDALSIRDNEGEAANYGIYYDDTEYDYMQHLRDVGAGGPGEVVFVESNTTANANKSKGRKQPLEQALRQLDLEHKSEGLVDKDMMPSKYLPPLSYQAQQDVPDEISGFQPDMDPRLKEVLEALEDDAYVDENDDIFQELAKDGEEVTLEEFEETFDDDDGWESDRTEKPDKNVRFAGDEVPQLVSATTENGSHIPPEGDENMSLTYHSENWMEAFKQFKKEEQKAAKTSKQQMGAVDVDAPTESGMTTTTFRRKKRKGALTNPSMYSMTSASLPRTEHMRVLDARFEKLEDEINGGFDDGASVSVMSTISTMSTAARQKMQGDLDSMADEFLETHPTLTTKRVAKNARKQNGLAQLAEIRRDLGAPRIPKDYTDK